MGLIIWLTKGKLGHRGEGHGAFGGGGADSKRIRWGLLRLMLECLLTAEHLFEREPMLA
jgi:hypothetical protein